MLTHVILKKNTDFRRRTSIDIMTEALSDTMLEESRDTLPMEAINTNRPEACKFTIMNLNTEKVVP